MDLRDMNINVNIEIVEGGFIITSPYMQEDGVLKYRRSVVNSPRKAIKFVSELLNEFKLTIEE
jgi:hypothetical protein